MHTPSGSLKLFILSAICLSACDNSYSGNQAADMQPSSNTRTIDGFETIKFGSSFEDAITDLGTVFLDPFSIRECLKDLPLKGCFISSNYDGPPFQIKDGIPYFLTLSFNRFDKLTDIDLNYQRAGDISRAECLEIHERTLDWLSREYGQMRASSSSTSSEVRVTAHKNSYSVYTEDKAAFVTSPMRTLPNGRKANLDKLPITEWDDGRYASILSSFIVAGSGPTCHVNVSFNEPTSVERRNDTF